MFHRRDEMGVPTEWTRMVRRSLMTIGPRFSAARMLRDYLDGVYSVRGASPQPVVRPPDALRRHLRNGSGESARATDEASSGYTTAWSMPDDDAR